MNAKVGMLIFALIMAGIVTVPAALAATPEQIESSIQNGTAWLAANQNPDGSWGMSNKIAETGLILYKLIDRAIELEKDPLEICGPSPSATCYIYAQNVRDGLNFTNTYTQTISMTLQNHTASATGTVDNPDTNGNGIGLAWESNPGWDRKSYTTGIITAALSLLDGTRTAEVGPYSGTAYSVIVQDAVDWLAYAQSDFGSTEGGWEYNGQDNGQGGDNSVSGYAVLGLAEAQSAGYTIPAWVKTELNVWIKNVQDPVNGDADDGGSWYVPIISSWVNILKTGNLIEEMTLFGDSNTESRVVNATDYIVRHFFDTNAEPGWGYTLNPASYQAMFTTMKGLEYAGIDLLDMDNDGTPEFDWWLNFTDVIVAQEIPSGTPGQSYWNANCGWGDENLCTAWALLTLEKTAPTPPEEIEGFMTGGGSVFTKDGKRVTHGFELNCDKTKTPNNLEINWGKSNKFHLDTLTSASCTDDSSIDPGKPGVEFDTYKGTGTGKYNGVVGATAQWTFTDAGEPGSNDTASIQITDVYGNVVLTVSGNLNNGNQQAHKTK